MTPSISVPSGELAVTLGMALHVALMVPKDHPRAWRVQELLDRVSALNDRLELLDLSNWPPSEKESEDP